MLLWALHVNWHVELNTCQWLVVNWSDKKIESLSLRIRFCKQSKYFSPWLHISLHVLQKSEHIQHILQKSHVLQINSNFKIQSMVKKKLPKYFVTINKFICVFVQPYCVTPWQHTGTEVPASDTEILLFNGCNTVRRIGHTDSFIQW